MFPPTSSPTPRRARRRMALLGAVLALLLLGGCTGRKPTPTDYGETTRTNFLRGCTRRPSGVNVSNPQDVLQVQLHRDRQDDPLRRVQGDQLGALRRSRLRCPPKMLKIRDRLHRADRPDLRLRLRQAPPPPAHRPAASWAGAGAPGPGNSIAVSGQRLRLLRDSLCISAMAPGSSSPGRASIAPVREHPLDDLAAEVGADDRERPVVVLADAAGGDVGVLGGEVGAVLAALARPRVALLERHLVVVAVRASRSGRRP